MVKQSRVLRLNIMMARFSLPGITFPVPIPASIISTGIQSPFLLPTFNLLITSGELSLIHPTICGLHILSRATNPQYFIMNDYPAEPLTINQGFFVMNCKEENATDYFAVQLRFRLYLSELDIVPGSTARCYLRWSI